MDAPPPSPLDAIVVLGCLVHDGGRLSEAASRRVTHAASAFAELGPRHVIASGGRAWGGVTEADALADGLAKRGVPCERIRRELCSLSTVENAWYTAEMLRASPGARIGLVTCDWHMPRALLAFERVGLRALPLPSPSPQGTSHARWLRDRREIARSWLDARIARAWTGA